MMASELPTAVWEGTFTLCGISLRCAVLDNGARVIDAEDFMAWMEAMATGENPVMREEAEKFMLWQRGVDDGRPG